MPWEVQVKMNPAVKPAGLRREEPPRGPYQVLITKSELDNPKDQKTKVKDTSRQYVRCFIKIEGPDSIPTSLKGLEFPTIVNLPAGRDAKADEVTESFLKKTLVSLGFNADALGKAAGAIKVSDKTFDNKRGTIFYEPSDPSDRESFGEVKWLSPEEYAKVLAGEIRPAEPKRKAPAAAGGKGKGDTEAARTVQGAGGTEFEPGDIGSLDGDAAPNPPNSVKSVVDDLLQ